MNIYKTRYLFNEVLRYKQTVLPRCHIKTDTQLMLTEKYKKIDEKFKKLQSEHKNTVGHLIKWIQDAKLLEKTEEGEKKARELFGNAAKDSKVKLEKFKEIINKLTAKPRMIIETGVKYKKATEEGIKAFKQSLAKDKK